MSETKARTGHDTRFALATGTSDDFADVAEVTALTPPGMTRDAIDATRLDAPDAFKEFIAGLKEGGEASVTVNYVPAVNDRLMQAFDAGRIRARITFPALDGGSAVTLTFTAIVTAWSLNEVVAADKMSASFTAKCSGRPVFSTESV